MNIIEVAADETALNIEIQFWYKEIGPQGVKNTRKPAPGGWKIPKQLFGWITPSLPHQPMFWEE